MSCFQFHGDGYNPMRQDLCFKSVSIRIPLGLVIACTFLLAIGGCSGVTEESPNTKADGPTTAFVRESEVVLVPPADNTDLTVPASPKAADSFGAPENLPLFNDIASKSGIAFTYDNGASSQRLMVEATGGGAGWLDFDRDSNWDLYLVQGGSPILNEEAKNQSDELLRNLGAGSFAAVTDVAGIEEKKFGQGNAVGDFDGDGFDDIYITNVGRDTLLHNQGDGTFRDVTAGAMELNLRWASSAAWADLDQDDDLDLFVCNYVEYDPDVPIACFGDDGKPGICHPRDVEPVMNRYYLNNGDGTFLECLKEKGLDADGSKSLGLVIADFNSDHWSDIYVANDTTANHLFINRGDGTFYEDGVPAGCAASGMGQFQASMGVAFGDYDQDGLFDLYLTHFTSDSNTLYHGLPGGAFDDTTRLTGIHKPTLNSLGFGTVMCDFNADRRMDIMIANGHIDSSFVSQGDTFEMQPQLFTFDGNVWHELTAEVGPYFQEKRVGRAIALADYDNDGDPDAVIVNQQSPVALLKNCRRSGHWLKIVPVGQFGNRRGIGMEVVVQQGSASWRQVLAGGTSYAASHQPALFVGLGISAEPCDISVRWNSGKVQLLKGVSTDTEVLVLEREAK